MGTPTGTKKQHFVPQLLLRQFASRSGQLFVYDKSLDRSFPSNVRDTGQQNHFLSIPNLDGADGPGAYFERLFQTYESPAVLAISRVRAALASGMLTLIQPTEREVLSRFIALQFLRTPESRDALIQTVELARRALMLEVAKRVGVGHQEAATEELIERLSTVSSNERAALHANALLQRPIIETVAAKLAGHVWLLGVNNAGRPLYIGDHPVALHRHADGRGLGPLSYGVEVVFPLSSTLQLSLFDREYIRDDSPALEERDGLLHTGLDVDNVLYQRSVQVRAARQFVYCEIDDFADARRVCDNDPELRNPNRRRVEVTTSAPGTARCMECDSTRDAE